MGARRKFHGIPRKKLTKGEIAQKKREADVRREEERTAKAALLAEKEATLELVENEKTRPGVAVLSVSGNGGGGCKTRKLHQGPDRMRPARHVYCTPDTCLDLQTGNRI